MRRLAFVFGLSIAGCGVLLGADDDDDDIESPSGEGDAAPDATKGLAADGEVTTNAGDDSGADGSPGVPRRVVFVTQRTVDGNFGGLDAGDAICAAEAADAGLGGSFVAWLSNGLDEFNAKSRFVTDAGWYLTGDGGEVFSGPPAMTNVSAPQVGINRTAYAQIIPVGQVWTGLWGDGLPYGKDCAGWTTTQNDGVPGDIGATTTGWTGAAPDFCTAEKRLICFQK
jgi:hypothetical protein